MSQTKTQGGPDVRQLAQDGLPETSFPGGRKQPYRIFFDPAVHERVWKHATDTAAVEICGVLVGKWARDADGPFALISEAIRGEAATNKFAEVTFTHETWAKINEQMDTKFSTLSIVGWYHSHPNFGVFLSDRDRFIQEHFFSGPGQMAHVVDPVRKTEGVFVWNEGKPTLTPHYWIGNRVQVPTPAGQENVETTTAGSAPASAVGGASRAREADWLPILSQVALCGLLFLLGYMVAGHIFYLNRARIEDEAERKASAQAIVYWKIRPFFTEELNRARKSFEGAVERIAPLAKAQIKEAEDAKEMKEKWGDIFAELRTCDRRLQGLQATYGLSKDQLEFLNSFDEKAREDKAKARKKPSDKDAKKDGEAKAADKKAKDKDVKAADKKSKKE